MPISAHLLVTNVLSFSSPVEPEQVPTDAEEDQVDSGREGRAGSAAGGLHNETAGWFYY